MTIEIDGIFLLKHTGQEFVCKTGSECNGLSNVANHKPEDVRGGKALPVLSVNVLWSVGLFLDTPRNGELSPFQCAYFRAHRGKASDLQFCDKQAISNPASSICNFLFVFLKQGTIFKTSSKHVMYTYGPLFFCGGFISCSWSGVLLSDNWVQVAMSAIMQQYSIDYILT